VPIYEYEHIGEKGPSCDDPIEVMQSISEDALESCPECGNPVHRIVSQASFAFPISLNPDKTSKQGFTTYKRTGHGTYEKAAGEGPDTLDASKE
jgi:putative FmdB family regulatory protein